MGKESLYLGMLRMFVAGQATASQQIHELAAQGDTATAERLAHTLRGVAGNIGASAVQQAAADVELALRAGHDLAAIQRLLQPLHSLLTALVDALRSALDSLEPSAKSATVSPGFEATYRQLQALLQDADAESAEVFNQHRADFHAALGPAFHSIDGSINGYDFEEALALLDSTLAER